jgi:hypothetical protein
LTREDKSIFAVCAELVEAGKFVNLTKDIGKRTFFRICGNKPGVVWAQAANVTAKVTVLAYRNFSF